MNPSEAWSLLALRTVQLARQSSGHGALRSADIAGMLAGLEREPFLMGMAAELGDKGALFQLELCLWTRGNTIAEKENWDPPQGEFTVRRMAALALYDVIDERRCMQCNGKGHETFSLSEHPALVLASTFESLNGREGTVRCRACQGSTQMRLSGRKRADLAGINKDMWTRTWSKRYEPIFRIANDWRESARSYLARRLRDVELENLIVDKPPSTDRVNVPQPASKKTERKHGAIAVKKNL